MSRRWAAGALAVSIVALLGTSSSGYWSAETSAGGRGAAAAVTVNQGTTPTASVSVRTVTVTWAASTLSNGQAVSGYQVMRYDAQSGTTQTMLSACTGTKTTLTCTESNVPEGSWRYAVTPVVGTNWRGPESAKSAVAAVDVTAPVNNLSLTLVTGGTYRSGTTIYYRGAAAGSFRVQNAVSDSGSGPARSTSAALTGTTTGWSHTASAVATPSGGPFVSNPYSWTAGSTSAPTAAVTGQDVAGNSATTTWNFVNDSTAPSGASVSYPNGYQTGRSASVTFAGGTDTGSGVQTTRLQRSSAPLTGGACGAYGAFADIGSAGPTSPYVDSGLSRGCHKYRYVVTDRVGNQTIATNTQTTMIGYAGATSVTAGLVGHYRLGEPGLLTSDTFAGTAGVNLSSRSGETGASWTRHATTNSSDFVLTNAGRIRKNGINTYGALYFSSATPASADYSVSTDVIKVSDVVNDDAGVAGRVSTTTPTFYTAGYHNASDDWRLHAIVNGTPTLLGSWAETFSSGTRRVTLDMQGSSIRLLVDGVPRVSATSTAITAAGRGGAVQGFNLNGANTTITNTTGMHLDDLQVAPPASDTVNASDGTYVKSSSLGVSGALTGDADTAAQFDGVNDFARLDRDIADNLTVEFWFRSTQGLGTGAQWWQGAPLVDADLAGTFSDFGVSLRSDGRVVGGVGGAGDVSVVSTAGGFADGSWHHVAMTRVRASGLITLYVDGDAQGSTTAGTTSLTDPSTIYLARSGDGTKYFAGALDEVALYTTALSAAVIADRYQLGAAAS